MVRILEGGNWQNGSCAGSFKTSMNDYPSQHKCTSFIGLDSDDEKYDRLPQRWAAIIEAIKVRETEKVKIMLKRQGKK